MAKVLVSLPDELLREIDAQAKASGETRSGYLRRLAEADFENEERRGREEAKRLMDLIRADFGDEKDEPPPNAAQLIREDRDSR
jgi:metal-responsive CopG/Arc/MetJ family transcriptional regulator